LARRSGTSAAAFAVIFSRSALCPAAVFSGRTAAAVRSPPSNRRRSASMLLSLYRYSFLVSYRLGGGQCLMPTLRATMHFW
jgi:hypothetical protein